VTKVVYPDSRRTNEASIVYETPHADLSRATVITPPIERCTEALDTLQIAEIDVSYCY
jgi:hypothetical protein